MKKIAVLILVLAMGFAFANSAKATWFWSDDDLTISNWGMVSNDVFTKADSGDNSIGGAFVNGGTIDTGNVTAVAQLTNNVNSSLVAGCNCFDDVTIRNGGMVFNDIYTKAYSGDNSIHGMFVGGGLIDSGNAEAGSIIENVVNFTLVGGAI